MADCCDHINDQKHLLIIGGGSAAFAAAIRASEKGAKVTLVNGGLPIGGTCVNVGCVPSKTLVRAAEVLHKANNHSFRGIHSEGNVSDFREVIQQKRELVQELRQVKYLDVVENFTGFRRIDGKAKLIDVNAIEVNGEIIQGDRILIATGVTPNMPDFPGLEETDYLTNETLFELEDLPESLIVMGGGYVGLECAQLFARFGSKVTILQRSSHILSDQMPDIANSLTQYLDAENIKIVTNVSVKNVKRENGAMRIMAKTGEEQQEFYASHLMLATGRTPNTSGLNLEAIGVKTDNRGYVVVDKYLQTSVNGIYAAGDVLGENLYVYAAAYEGGLAAENALLGNKKDRDYTILPWVVFTDPQVAGVGLDERQAEEQGIHFEISVLPLSYVPRAIAARDTRGFIKLIKERSTDKLIGARIVAPEGSELLMELALAVKYELSTHTLSEFFHPYLTLSEGVKLAAISFGKSVNQLSCCAS